MLWTVNGGGKGSHIRRREEHLRDFCHHWLPWMMTLMCWGNLGVEKNLLLEARKMNDGKLNPLPYDIRSVG